MAPTTTRNFLKGKSKCGNDIHGNLKLIVGKIIVGILIVGNENTFLRKRLIIAAPPFYFRVQTKVCTLVFVHLDMPHEY